MVGRSQLLVAVAGARRSPCGVRLGEIRAARCVAVVVFVVLGGGPLLAEALLVVRAASFACWLARANEPAYPLLARANDRLPQDDQQDRCHRARDHDVPNAGASAEGPVGHFSRAAPGQCSRASKVGGEMVAARRRMGRRQAAWRGSQARDRDCGPAELVASPSTASCPLASKSLRPARRSVRGKGLAPKLAEHPPEHAEICDTAAMLVGSQIGSYRIEHVLGEGGMGVVYIGVDLRLGRRAAIKQLLPELSGQRHVVERFFNEAKAAANINHPGIVEIYEVGWHTDGSAYFAMKLLDGDSLAKRLRRGTMSLTTACTLARQIASALAAAHAAGIVHRDLKPDNIILVRDDEVAFGERPVVLDFGIAKLTGGGRTSLKTGTHVVMGTPSYMAPEQCRGAGEVDHRTDVYAVGCLLFEMLTGRPPFVAEGAGEVLGMHQFVQPPAVRSLRQEVLLELEAVVMRCLAKHPGQRYQTMSELITTLQACLPRLGAQDSADHAGPPAPLPGPMTVPPLPSTLTGGRGEIAHSPRLVHKRGFLLGAVAAAAAIAIAVVAAVSASSESGSEIATVAPESVAGAPDTALADATTNTARTAMLPAPNTPTPLGPVATAPTTAGATGPVPDAAKTSAAAPSESAPITRTPTNRKSSTKPLPTTVQNAKVKEERHALADIRSGKITFTYAGEVPKPDHRHAPEQTESAPTATGLTRDTEDRPHTPLGIKIEYTTSQQGNLPESLDQKRFLDGVAEVESFIMSCSIDSKAKGQVKVSVKVGADGNVISVTLLNTPEPAVSDCVVGIMQTARFAKTQSGGTFMWTWDLI